jgi:HPt (histidine-containing phosphotransfer) domain-containing protein
LKGKPLMALAEDSPRTDMLEAKVFDLEGVRERMGGEPELMLMVVSEMIKALPLELARLRAAFDAGDAQAVIRHAHTFKGLAATSGGARAHDVAQRLETDAKAGDLIAAAGYLNALAEQIELFSEAASAWLAEQGQGTPG